MTSFLSDPDHPPVFDNGQIKFWTGNGYVTRGAYVDPVTKQPMIIGDDGVASAVATNPFNIVNLKWNKYPRTTKALNAVRFNTANMDVWCFGDSITMGVNGDLSGAASVDVASSYARRLVDIIKKEIPGINAGFNTLIGDHSRSVAFGGAYTLSQIDPRVTLGAGWGGFDNFIGGSTTLSFLNSTTTNELVFTPSFACDTIDYYCYDYASAANLTITNNASTVGVTGSAYTAPKNKNEWVKVTASIATPNTLPWGVSRSAGAGFIGGLRCYDSTKKEVSFYNVGVGGESLFQFLPNTFTDGVFTGTQPIAQLWQGWPTLTRSSNGGNANALYGFPLAIISYGTNDKSLVNMTNAALFQAQLDYLVSNLQATGTECLLIAPYKLTQGLTAAQLAVWQGIIDSYYAVAFKYGCALIDINTRWPTQSNDLAPKYLGADNIHPSNFGYVDIASAIAMFFKSII